MTAVMSVCIFKNLSKLVTFCAAILILQIKKINNVFGVLCFITSRKVKTTEMQKKICAVYGEGAVTDQICQKWFVKFLGTIDILAK